MNRCWGDIRFFGGVGVAWAGHAFLEFMTCSWPESPGGAQGARPGDPGRGPGSGSLGPDLGSRAGYLSIGSPRAPGPDGPGAKYPINCRRGSSVKIVMHQCSSIYIDITSYVHDS